MTVWLSHICYKRIKRGSLKREDSPYRLFVPRDIPHSINQTNTKKQMKMKTTFATTLLMATIGVHAVAGENPFVREGLKELRTSDTHIEVPVAKAKITAVSKLLQGMDKNPSASLTRPGTLRLALHLADTFHGNTQTVHVEEVEKPFELGVENINSYTITLLDEGWIDQVVRGQHYQYVIAPGKNGEFVLESAKAWVIAWPETIGEVRKLTKKGDWGAQPAPSRSRDHVVPRLRKLGGRPSFAQVTAILGRPDKEVGSGIHIYSYRLSNGEEIRVGTTDNHHLSYIHHHQGEKEVRLFEELGE